MCCFFLPYSFSDKKNRTLYPLDHGRIAFATAFDLHVRKSDRRYLRQVVYDEIAKTPATEIAVRVFGDRNLFGYMVNFMGDQNSVLMLRLVCKQWRTKLDAKLGITPSFIKAQAAKFAALRQEFSKDVISTTGKLKRRKGKLEGLQEEILQLQAELDANIRKRDSARSAKSYLENDGFTQGKRKR